MQTRKRVFLEPRFMLLNELTFIVYRRTQEFSNCYLAIEFNKKKFKVRIKLIQDWLLSNTTSEVVFKINMVIFTLNQRVMPVSTNIDQP